MILTLQSMLTANVALEFYMNISSNIQKHYIERAKERHNMGVRHSTIAIAATILLHDYSQQNLVF